MAIPKYSILYNAESLESRVKDISTYVHEGVKVLWFGSADDCRFLKERFQPFMRCRILQAFETNNRSRFQIIDGDLSSNRSGFETICAIKSFNSEQYLVEHSTSKDIMVEASAGTGKTSVMVDRIMYLLHTKDDLEPSEIAMITFTNEATNQMNERLQRELMDRYEVTSNHRYLEWLEKQSQMSISTIHSFVLNLLRRIGLTHGLTKNVSIGSFRHEVDQAIYHVLDEMVDEDDNVENQLGLNLYNSCKLIHDFWDKLMQKGLTVSEIESLDWGRAADYRSSIFQDALVASIDSMDDVLYKVKMKRDEVPLSDLIRDLNGMLNQGDVVSRNLGIKYLFVDEFQDSDDSQIEIVSKLACWQAISLFVVGDVKQSIYRFRGADDSAFNTLSKSLSNLGCTEPKHYSLVNNYRTAPDVLDEFRRYFKQWSDGSKLPCQKPVVACKKSISGRISVKSVPDINEDYYIDDVVESLRELNSRVGARKPDDSEKVVVLVRSNYDLGRVSQMCRRHKVPLIVKREGSFFISDAVRDFHSAVSSFVLKDSKTKFNYLMSPYSGLVGLPDLNKMDSFDGDMNLINGYIEKSMESTPWHHFDKRFRTEPALAVINDLVDVESILESYIARRKDRYSMLDWNPDDVDGMVLAESKQYLADLGKLMEVIHRTMTGTNPSLYNLYRYLDLMIRTNRSEESATVSDDSDSRCAYCMTVHKAKGLEFDTVFIPYTNRKFRFDDARDILVNRETKKIGWKYKDDSRSFSNDNYPSMRREENLQVTREETRILYVAMTRTVRNLNLYVPMKKSRDTWAELIDEGRF